MTLQIALPLSAPEVVPDESDASMPPYRGSDSPPSMGTMMGWPRGKARALDGCWVKPDGTCEHGKPSWLKYLGFV